MLQDRRTSARKAVDAPATLYDKDGQFLLPCVVRDLSQHGGKLELFKETTLPKYFFVSMMPDGSARRLCSRVWQLARVAGIHFVENQAAA